MQTSGTNDIVINVNVEGDMICALKASIAGVAPCVCACMQGAASCQPCAGYGTAANSTVRLRLFGDAAATATTMERNVQRNSIWHSN
jgi:ABC-type transporter Mla maintaining outer membrane lipid asymmetry permease subunit MlaE